MAWEEISSPWDRITELESEVAQLRAGAHAQAFNATTRENKLKAHVSHLTHLGEKNSAAVQRAWALISRHRKTVRMDDLHTALDPDW